MTSTVAAPAEGPLAQAAAIWMKAELEAKGELYQEDAAHHIATAISKDLVHENENGNLGIEKTVLKAFKKITPDTVWELGERRWRPRVPTDKPGRQQD